MNPVAMTATTATTAAAKEPGADLRGRSPEPVESSDLLATAEDLRARGRWQAGFSGFLTAVLASTAVVTGAAIALRLSHVLDGRWSWIMVGALCSAAATLIWAIWRGRSRRDLATWCAQRTVPSQQERVRTAVELAQAKLGAYGSGQLANLAMQQGAPGLAHVRVTLQLEGRYLGLRAIVLGLVACGLFWGVPADHWQRLRRPPPPPRPALREVGTLVVDLQLRGMPPLYARDTTPVVIGTDGDADVLRGSVVSLQARPIAGIHHMQLEVQQAPAVQQPPAATDEEAGGDRGTGGREEATEQLPGEPSSQALAQADVETAADSPPQRRKAEAHQQRAASVGSPTNDDGKLDGKPDGKQVEPTGQTRRRRKRISLTPVAGLIRWQRPVQSALRYRYRAIADDGAPMVERTWREISVHADTVPKATLRAPKGELEVRGGDEVVLEGTARDDLGLTHVGVAIALPSGQVRRRDVAITTGDLRVEIREALSVDSLKLAPGELATVWLEAKDNNERDGHRNGSSARVTLRMFSAERHHERLLAAVAAVALRWTLRLADRLEGSPARSKADLTALVERRANFVASERNELKGLERLRERLGDDVLARGRTAADLKEITRRLNDRISDESRVIQKIRRGSTGLGATIEHGRIVRVHTKVVDSQERAVVQLAALAAAEHRAAMVRDSKALVALEKKLAAVLEALKKQPNDSALQAQAERLLDAIEARMKRIAASAARQLKMTPPEHINSGASNAKGMQASLQAHTSTLEDVRAKLRGGDFRGALAALKAGRDKLAKPLQGLHETAAKERSAEDAALERLVAELLRGIAATERGEEGLQREVEPSATAQRVAAAELLRRRLQTSLPQIQRLLDDARDQIRPKRLRSYQVRNSRPLARGRAALSTAQQAVGRGGIDRALQGLLEAREQLAATAKATGDGSEAETRPQDLRRVRTALDRSARAAALLRELLPSPEALHDAPTQRVLRRNAGQQDRLRRKLDRVRRALERRGHAHPALQRQVGARLAHGSGMMRQVSGSLAESDAARAHEQMAEVRSALAQAKRLLNKRNNGQDNNRASGTPGGRPRQTGGGARRGGRQAPGQDDGLGGRSGDTMRLKAGNRTDSGEDFRRDVLKAMKRRAPSGYDARLRRYYRGLTETP